MSPRFLCAGDLHLGAGTDLGREPGERLAEQEAVWSRILEVAAEHEAWVLFAGDAFEGPIPTPEHYAAFKRPILERVGRPVPILAVTGNGRHDAALRDTNALDVLDVNSLDVISRPQVVPFGGAAVCCLPWAPVTRVVAEAGGGDRDEINRQVADGVVAIARGLYAEAHARTKPDEPIVLLGHWSVGGAETPTGVPVDIFREPVLPLEELVAIGFDAIILGHIHRHQVLCDDPRVAYVGSPMPLSFGEVGCDHGVLLLELTA